MNGLKNIKKAIEAQRERLDRMAKHTDDLNKLLEESRKMDRLIEKYEDQVQLYM
ncbi:MAG TPA: hypothetical protein DD414_09745 [Lachnospiraceae bacterium]|nr:hypothetical protein [Lachnospiraceae bacterium]